MNLPPAQTWLGFLSQRLQFDKPLFYSLLAKAWQAVTGPVTLTLVLTAMTLPEQGIYYGLVNVVGIQSLFEMGLLNVLISHAGYAYSALNSDQSEQRSAASGKLRSLVHVSQRWFLCIALLFAVVAIALGWRTFSNTGVRLPWHWPLLAVVPIVALTVSLSPHLAILEGAGQRASIYRFRFWQMIAGSLTAWAALLSGLQLWTIVLVATVQAGFAMHLVWIEHRDFWRRLNQHTEGSGAFRWVQDVLPMQWRAGIISVAHYLASQTFVLVVLNRAATDAADEAGRMGPTLTIVTAIQSLALAWVQTKYSVVSAHHGAGQRETAGELWRQTTVVSSSLLVLGLGTLVIILAAMPLLGRGIENNFIQPWQLATLSVGLLANHLLAIQSYYVMARGANPFWIPTTVGFLITAASVYYFGASYSVAGVVSAYTLSMACIALPLHSVAYWKFRRAL